MNVLGNELHFRTLGWDSTSHALLSERLIGSVAVRNAPLLEIVGRHLDLHAISRENADAVDAHTTGQGAEELVVFRLGRENPDAEGGIRERFLHDAGELDNVLSQEGRCGNPRAGASYRRKRAPSSEGKQKTRVFVKMCCV